MNSYRIYKPNRNGNGSASKWDLAFKQNDRYSPWKVFLSMAAQAGCDEKGNNRFNWDKPITVRMDLSDVSEILSVLEWKQTQLGSNGKIFHQNGENNKIMVFNYNQNTNNYFMKVSHQSADGVVTLQQNISLAEGCVIKVLLSHAILKLTSWAKTASAPA